MKILGDYHTHTKFSDGRATVLEMARAAKEKGLVEIAVTDHGFGMIVGGLRKRKVDNLRGEIQSAVAELPVLVGIEANLVNCRGDTCLDPESAKNFDIVIFGIHLRVLYGFRAFFSFLLPNLLCMATRYTPKWRIRANTQIVKRVIENNRVDIWAHPGKFFKVDVVEIAKTCAERGTLIELNGKRISFRPIDYELMAKAGAKFIINSDAHSTRRVGDTARVEEFLKYCDYNPADIINLTQTYTEYKKSAKGENTDDGNIQPNQDQTADKGKRSWFRRWF